MWLYLHYGHLLLCYQHSEMCCRRLCFSRLALALDLEPSPHPAQVLYYSKMVYGLLSFPFLLFVTPMVALTLALTLTLFRTLAPAPAQTPR